MKNDTQRTAILLLSELFCDGITKNKVIQDLNIKETTFYKYIQYIKEAGFVVQKNKDSNYRVLTFANGIQFDFNDEAIFVELLFLADNYLSKSKADAFKRILMTALEQSGFHSYSNVVSQYNLLKSSKFNKENHKKIELFQNSIQNNKTLEAKTKQGTKLLIKPTELLFEKERIYINFYNKEERVSQKLPIDFFTKISVVEDRDIYIESIKETIFELNGNLALSYILKENERVVDKLPNKIVIANSTNNKKDLFKRLLRYDVFCKILFPKHDVEDFRNFIRSSLENIV